MSMTFNCPPPHIKYVSVLGHVPRGKFDPRISDVKCSEALVNINPITRTVMKTSNCPFNYYFLIKKVMKSRFYFTTFYLADAVPNIVFLLALFISKNRTCEDFSFLTECLTQT